jgi:hypothetical protein
LPLPSCLLSGKPQTNTKTVTKSTHSKGNPGPEEWAMIQEIKKAESWSRRDGLFGWVINKMKLLRTYFIQT